MKTRFLTSITLGIACWSAAHAQCTINDQTVTVVQPSLCASGIGTIQTSGSQVGVTYSLRDNNGNSVIDGSIDGTGSALSFTTGLISSTTSYNVYAERLSTGLALDGTDDYIDLDGTLLSNLPAFTLEGWFYVSSTNAQSLFGQNDVIETALDGTDLILYTANGGSESFAHGMSLNTWNHIAFVGDGTTLTIYVNGVSIGTGGADASGNYGSSGDAAKIGGYVGDNSTANFSDGKFDEVRFWNYARSASEISGAMNTCLAGTETGLIAYYTFEDGTGSNILSNEVGTPNGLLINVDVNSAWEQHVVTGSNLQLTDIVTINVVSPPTINITGNTSVCAGNTTVLTASGADTYTWSANAGSVTTETVSLPSTNDTYTVTATLGVCEVTETVTVTELALPNVGFTGSTSGCSGETFSLTATGAVTYTWTSAAGSTTLNPLPPFPASAGTATLTGDDGTCTNTVQIVTTVTATPNFTISGNTTICEGGSTILEITNGTADSYTWSANAGGVTTTTVEVSPSAPETYTVTGSADGCERVKTVTIGVLLLPTINITGTTSICSNESTVLTADGATTYTWSANAGSATTESVSVTADDTYTVTGNDGSCSNTQTVAVTVTAAPTLSISGNTTICAGDNTLLTASGSTTYTWSANAAAATTETVEVSPSADATYTVSSFDGTCTGTQTITVAVTALPTLNITGNTSICNGDNTVLTAAGATSYTWSANAAAATTETVDVNPTADDTYTVNGEDNGCVSTETVTVSVNAVPSLSITSSSAAVCEGSAVSYTAAGATSYTWSANAGGVTTDETTVTPAADDTYTVTGANGGCVRTETVDVTVNTLPSVSFATLGFVSPVCDDLGVQTLSGGSPSGGTYTGTGVTGTSFDPAAAGTGTFTITYSYTDANTCSNTATNSVVVETCVPTSVSSLSADQTVSVYPNPGTGIFHLDMKSVSDNMVVEVYSVIGAKVYTSKLAGLQNELNLSGMTNGVYYVKVLSGSSLVHQTKVVKQN